MLLCEGQVAQAWWLDPRGFMLEEDVWCVHEVLQWSGHHWAGPLRCFSHPLLLPVPQKAVLQIPTTGPMLGQNEVF